MCGVNFWTFLDRNSEGMFWLLALALVMAGVVVEKVYAP